MMRPALTPAKRSVCVASLRLPPKEDIEGSHPAIRKFGRWNQRIAADPYPDCPHAPRRYGERRDVQPSRYRAAGAHPFHDPGANSIVVSRRQAFVPGHGYVAVTQTMTPHKQRSDGIIPHGPRAPQVFIRSSSLSCCDIAGASPRGYYQRLQERRSRTPVRDGEGLTPRGTGWQDVSDITGRRSPTQGRATPGRRGGGPTTSGRGTPVAHTSRRMYTSHTARSVYPDWWC